MNLFVQSLIDDAREWYKILPNTSISKWMDFKKASLEEYGDHNDLSFSIHELASIKKGYNESMVEFNKIFHKIFNNFPPQMKPNDEICQVFYMDAYDRKKTMR